jgi:hypothetical protein
MRAAFRSPHETATDHEGEPAFRIAAVKVLLDHLLDDRSEKPILIEAMSTAKPVLPLETIFIFGQEPLEMMEKRPVENAPLRMSRTIDSRHSRRIASRNGPMSWMRSGLPEKQEEPRLRKCNQVEKTSTVVVTRRRQWETQGYGHNGPKDEPFRHSHESAGRWLRHRPGSPILQNGPR